MWAAVHTSTWANTAGGGLLIAVQILRTSFMQGYSPVSRSILNDYAPKDERARWNSLSSLQKVHIHTDVSAWLGLVPACV